MGFKILHTADWHVCSEFMDDAKRCLEFTVEHVAQRGDIDLIVIPGDVYNHRQIQQETESARLAFNTVRHLSRYAPVVIITGTPSHDGQAPMILDEIGAHHAVLVVNQPSQWVLYKSSTVDEFLFSHIELPITGTPKAIISCTPAFTKQFFESGSDIATSDNEIAEALSGIFAKFGLEHDRYQRDYRYSGSKSVKLPHVGLGHYSIGGAYIHPNQPMIGKDIEISLDHLRLAHLSINCLGHIHAAQNVGSKNFYSGSLFATNFGEFEEKGFFIHDIESDDYGNSHKLAPSEFIKTPSPMLVKIEINLIKNSVPAEDITDYVLHGAPKPVKLDNEAMPCEDVDNCIVRMEIRTFQDEAQFIDRPVIENHFKAMGLRSFDLTIIRIPRENIRSSSILEADRLKDKITARADIIGEALPEGVLDMADDLQDADPDKLIEQITKSLTRGKENDTNENKID